MVFSVKEGDFVCVIVKVENGDIFGEYNFYFIKDKDLLVCKLIVFVK